MDNETWLLETGGDCIEKQNGSGLDSLTNFEKLVYYFWTLDYSMRNAGDLDAGYEVDENYYDECVRLADELGATKLAELMKNPDELLTSYQDQFDTLCSQVRELSH